MTHETPSPPPSPALSPDDAAIVAEECGLAAHVCAHLAARVAEERAAFNFDGELVTLRDQVAEAKPEDVAPLLEQMLRAAALRQHVGQGSAAAVDANSPYFGHLGLAPEDAAPRDVLLGKQTYIDAARGVRIVDWRHAPVSRVFYQYREGQDYAETFGRRTRYGTVTVRRTVTI